MNKNKFFGILINWDIIISGIMLCILVVCTFFGAIARSMSSPFNWLEEVQLFCQVWIVFCGGCAAFRYFSHVEVEFIAELLPELGQKIVLIINSAVLVVVLGYLCINSWDYLQTFISSGRTTNVLGISYVLVYGIAPITVFFMIVNYFFTIKKQWKDIEERCGETALRKGEES